MRKKINLTDIVVYNKKKRRTRRDIDEVVKKTDEQQAGVNQLTDQDGFDRPYCGDNDLAVIDNTVYIAFCIIVVTVPVSWYTAESNKKYISELMVAITPLLHALFRKETITQLHSGLLCVRTMNDNCPYPGPTGGTTPTICVSIANLANNTIIIPNANDTFEILTDTQVVALMYMGLYPAKIPT